jgi:hypothetical protein
MAPYLAEARNLSSYQLLDGHCSDAGPIRHSRRGLKSLISGDRVGCGEKATVV